MSASAYQLHQLPHYGRHALALDATDWVCADLLAHHFAGRSTRSRLCSDLGMRYVAAEAERLQAKIPERLAVDRNVHGDEQSRLVDEPARR